MRAAARAVAENQFGSARLVASKTGLSIREATDLMDVLEHHKWVGPHNAGMARDVLVLADQVDDRLQADFPDVAPKPSPYTSTSQKKGGQ